MNFAKLSTRRLIDSREVLELYTYERPYIFNLSPVRVSSSSVSSDPQQTINARRNDNLGLVRQEIRRLIECNFTAYGYEPCFLTFTFKENITDVGVANKYFHDFIKRLNRAIGKKARYLTIVEFQKRGAVHYHCIFFNLDPAIERRERSDRYVARLWRHGFIDIERIRHAKSVSAYVCKYLQKGLHDPRLRGRKSYFTSRALFRPLQFRRESSIDEVLQDASIEEVSVEHYESIKRGHVIKRNYARRRIEGV